MLQIKDLTYRIAGRTLLEDASVHIPMGHKVGLVGRNGTGKSTLFKLITTDQPPADQPFDVLISRFRRGNDFLLQCDTALQ